MLPFPFPRRNTGSTSCDVGAVLCALTLVVGLSACAPSIGRYRWDMEARPGSLSMRELRARRLVVRGLTEAQVKAVWGHPQKRVEIPPGYMSLTWKTREGWLTVVFQRGRVRRVEALTREMHPAGARGTSETPNAAQ